MRTKFIQILEWFGVMAVLTVIALLCWSLGGGNQSTASLKWLQFMQTVATFLLPPVICAWMWDSGRKPFRWLKMDKGADWRVFVWAVAVMICAIPGINLLADLNSRVELPESLDFIEQILKQQEEAAAALTERFLAADSVWGLLVNVGLMALLPAMAEELSFRGTLQQTIYKVQGDKVQSTKVHAAVWVTAFVFSAIHMQFYGFVPRMLMGALFGYVFVWTGSLWVPITMHFTNNGIAVLVYYFSDEIGENGTKYADTIGAGNTWWLGVLSLLAVGCLLWLFTFRDRLKCDRRIRRQGSSCACGYPTDAEQGS